MTLFFSSSIKYSSLNGGLKINLIFSLELTQMLLVLWKYYSSSKGEKSLFTTFYDERDQNMIKSVCIDSGWVKSFFTSLLHNLLFLFSNRNWKSFCQFYKRTFWQKHYNCEKDMKFHKSGETTRSWEDYPWWYWLFSLCIIITFTLIYFMYFHTIHADL